MNSYYTSDYKIQCIDILKNNFSSIPENEKNKIIKIVENAKTSQKFISFILYTLNNITASDSIDSELEIIFTMEIQYNKIMIGQSLNKINK